MALRELLGISTFESNVHNLSRQFYFAVWIDITWMPMMQSTSSVGGRQMQEIFPPLSVR